MMDWTVIYYIASWFVFGLIAFIFAFMKELSAMRKLREENAETKWFHALPLEQRQRILTLAGENAAKWFTIGFLSALTTFALEFLFTGMVDYYFTWEGLWIVAGVVLTPVIGENGVRWLIKFIKSIGDHFSKLSRSMRKKGKLLKKLKKKKDQDAKRDQKIKELEAQAQ